MTEKDQNIQQSALHSMILTTVLDTLTQGIVMFSSARQLLVWNKYYEDEFQLPKSLLRKGTPAVDIALFFAERGNYGDGDPLELAQKRLSDYWDSEQSRSEITVHNDKTYDVLSHIAEDGSLFLTFTDITAHKKTENALRKSEERFKDFAGAASDWYWELDEKLRFIYVSDAIMQYNGGIDPEKFYGKTPQELGSRNDITSDAKMWPFADLEARRPFKDFEYSIVDRTGIKQEVLASGRPIFDDEGTFLGYRGASRDITKRKKMERSLRQHQQLLERQLVDLRDSEERLALQASELVSVAEELALAEGKMKFLANHDALTSLPSLRLCKDRIETAMKTSRRNNTRFALMFIDLDGFKAINDTFGHETGDMVLKEVSSRIQSYTREVDTVARIGGDEFVVVFSGMEERRDVAHLAMRIIAALSDPFRIGDAVATIGSSIGIAVFPDDDQSADGLLRRADQAMYQVKQSGKNNFGFALEN